MAHKHSVYDTDLHFKIDNVTRNITSESGKVILMQNDHNSERFTFEIPRMVDGHDMSVCNLVEVHYINTDSANKRNQMKDVYPITDLQVSPYSDDVVIGSWLISQNATMYAGTLHFLIRYACIADDNTTIDYQWFTNIYSVITIAKGIYNTDVVTDEGDSDTLAAWKAEVMAMVQPHVDSAAASAAAAANSESEAYSSASKAKLSELTASTYESYARGSADRAAKSETEAKASETKAAVSEENARASEVNAKFSEEFAANAVAQIDNLNDEVLENLREVSDAVDEYNARIGNTTFTVNLETGELEYESPDYIFYVNEETGNLEWETLHEHSNAAEVMVEDIRTEKSDAIVLTASGESIVVNNSSNDQLRGLRIFGKTEQLTTTGKNLFNINADVAPEGASYVRDDSSITVIADSDLSNYGHARIMFENIKVDASKTYTISFDTNSTENVRIGWYGCGKSTDLSGKTHYSFTVSDVTTSTFSVGTTVPSATIKFSNIQIEEGTVETSYEPYTGGVASPSPNYSQRLKSIGVGKNLLQNTAKNLTYGGVTFTVNSDGSVTANGTATEILFFKINSIELKKGVSYILSGCPANGNNATYSIKCELADSSVFDYGTGVTIVGDGRKDCPVNLRITQGTKVDNLVFKPMLRYADIEDSTYEPYGKDDVEVGVLGKNLFDITKASTYNTQGLSAVINSDGSLIINGTPDSQYAQCYFRRVQLDPGVYYISGGEKKAGAVLFQINVQKADGTVGYYANKSFTVDGTETRIDVMIQNTSAGLETINNYTLFPMISRGTTATPFEPYTKQPLTALTPNGLPGIKVTDSALVTYTDANGQMWCADEVDFERGVYVKRVKTLVLNSTMSFVEWYTKNGNRVRFMYKVSDMVDISGRLYAISNFFSAKALGEVYVESADNAVFMDVTSSSTNRYIGICSSAITTRAELNTFLDANEVVVHYILATPIERSLSKEELAAYKSLHTNYPTTTVINDSDAYMELKYNADVKSYIDFKMEELKALLTANK